MKEKIIEASDLKPTFIHKPDNSKRQGSWAWFDGLLSSGQQSQIPPIVAVAVRGPATEEYFIYDGNIRLAHALLHDYSLRTLMIENQNDLDEYLSKNSICWFGVRDFSTLLKFMRLYAANPQEGSIIDPEIAEFLEQKESNRIASHRAEAAKLFDWHNDD